MHRIKMKLFCRHNKYPLEFVRNIYGDEINTLNARSIWKCPNCGRLVYKHYLNKEK